MKNVFKFIGLIAVVAVIGFLSACKEPDNNGNDTSNENGEKQGNSDIDSALYGTWRNDNDTLVITFSSDGITWGGTVGNAFSYLPSGTKWTAKNGAISHIYSGTTTKAYDYYIDSSGDLILTSIAGANYTLTKDGGNYKTFGYFYYREENSTITITGYDAYKINGAVNIPSMIDGKPVTTIGNGAFSEKNLTGVTIPNSVITIENQAFAYNTSLTSVVIPDSVTFIGWCAFSLANYQTGGLTSIVIGSGVITIEYDAFAYNQLTNVTIPNSVTSLSGFRNNKLTSVTIPNSVTTIGDHAFDSNPLTSVIIGNSVTSIGWTAFYTDTLTSVTIGANVNLGTAVFGYGYTNAQSLDYVYNNNGKSAGTYTRANDSGSWSKQ